MGAVGWVVICALALAWEAVALTRGSTTWPTLSDIFDAIMRPTVGRWLLFAGWLWLGWHLFVRGWRFFLRT